MEAMLIRRRSPMTGKVHEWELPVTPAQIAAWLDGTLIQNAMPKLSPPQREFVKSGYTPQDWGVMDGRRRQPAKTGPRPIEVPDADESFNERQMVVETSETWNTCPDCGQRWADPVPTPGVLHRTRRCVPCAQKAESPA